MAKSKKIDVCCNPFSKHRNVKKKLRSIGSYLVAEAKRLNVTLAENDYICDAARVEIATTVAKHINRDNVCCNPFSVHGNNIKKKIRAMTTDIIKRAKQLNVTIKTDQFLCGKCRLRILHSSVSTSR